MSDGDEDTPPVTMPAEWLDSSDMFVRPDRRTFHLDRPNADGEYEYAPIPLSTEEKEMTESEELAGLRKLMAVVSDRLKNWETSEARAAVLAYERGEWPDNQKIVTRNAS